MAPVLKFVVLALISAVLFGVSGLEASAPAPLVARLNAAFASVEGSVPADGAGGQGGGGCMLECWGAVTELRSCTNEIVLFFLSGDSYLGHDCCLAIRTITRHCWPSMLASVGFTAEEADVLRGFCDAEMGSAHAPPATPSLPPTAPAPAQSRSYL